MIDRRLRGALLGLPLGLAVMLSGCATGAPSSEAPPLTDAERQLHLDSFDQVWETVRDQHWDPELGGLDWQAVRDELRPRAAGAETVREVRSAMRDMLDRLGQSHFGIIPADSYQDIDLGGSGETEGSSGVEIRILDGRPLVSRVVPGSAAAEAGVGTGWELLRVRDRNVRKWLEKATDDSGEKLPGYYLHNILNDSLQGAVDEALELVFLDGEDRRRELALRLSPQRGERYEFGHLPPGHVWIERRWIGDEVGYVGFNMFMKPGYLMPIFGQAIREYADAEAQGMVLDLRGNPGGIGGMAMGIAGWLTAEKNQLLGTMHMRDSTLKFTINRRPAPYSGPVAVLVDSLSASTSEILAGGLQDLGRAKIFGSRSAGAALPSQIVRLPNGDGFQFAVANYISAGGEPLEGKGVEPDVEIVPSREALLAGRDPVLESAVEWILQQS